jgi:hypothetical protein
VGIINPKATGYRQPILLGWVAGAKRERKSRQGRQKRAKPG